MKKTFFSPKIEQDKRKTLKLFFDKSDFITKA